MRKHPCLTRSQHSFHFAFQELQLVHKCFPHLVDGVCYFHPMFGRKMRTTISISLGTSNFSHTTIVIDKVVSWQRAGKWNWSSVCCAMVGFDGPLITIPRSRYESRSLAHSMCRLYWNTIGVHFGRIGQLTNSELWLGHRRVSFFSCAIDVTFV